MELIPITLIKTNQYHCKNRVPEISNKIRASIIKTGQVKNIIVRQLETADKNGKLYEVVKGNTVFEMLKEEGFTDVWCFNLGEKTLQEAWLVYLQTISINEYNFVAVSELVNQLLEVIDIAEIEKVTSFTFDELMEIKNIMNFNWDKYNPKVEITQHSLFDEQD